MENETQTQSINSTVPITIASTEIKPNAVYTTEETRDLLKVSTSTIKRMLKKALSAQTKLADNIEF